MKKMKSTKTSASNEKNFLQQIRTNADNSYFLEVVYYYVRRALIKCDYNLKNVEGFEINGRFLGRRLEMIFSHIYNTPLKSLSLALSIRAFMLNKNYIMDCYDNRLLFYDLDTNVITWNAHRAIMECIFDDDFRQLYEMVESCKLNYDLTNEQKVLFESNTIKPEYRNREKFYQSLAKDPEYIGSKIIKNNAFLYDTFESYVVPKNVEYIGNTAFAYCKNLAEITFEGKVLFGKFSIIECNNLKQIIVPADLVDYYKQLLPYYNDIISDTRKSNTEENSLFDKDKIWHVFEKKQTSYKFFWLLAILDIYYKRHQITIPYKNIVAKMAAIAWKYIFDIRLDFGKVDQLEKYLSEVKKIINLDNDADESLVEESIIENYDSLGVKGVLSPLLKNVPYRFLSPWIPFTTQDEVINKSCDKDTHCLYRLLDEEIDLNPEWLNFLRDNYDEIKGFVNKELEKTYPIKSRSDDTVISEEIDVTIDGLEEEDNNDDKNEWYFVDNIPFNIASKYFLSYNCRVVLSEFGYYLEVSGKYIKLGDYPKPYFTNDGNIWIKKQKNELGLRMVHECMKNHHFIGYIREEGDLIIFTKPDGEVHSIELYN